MGITANQMLNDPGLWVRTVTGSQPPEGETRKEKKARLDEAFSDGITRLSMRLKTDILDLMDPELGFSEGIQHDLVQDVRLLVRLGRRFVG